MAIKRKGIVAQPGEYKYGETVEKKTAAELKAAAERQPIIMLTKGHPADGMPSARDAIGTLHQDWNDEKQRVDGEFWFHEEKVPDIIRERLLNNQPIAISPGFLIDGIDKDGVQQGIVYTHMAILTEEDPRCPLEKCGVNIRMDSKDGKVSLMRFDQKTEIETVPKEPKAKPSEPVKEAPKVAAEAAPVAPPIPIKEGQQAPAAQKPEAKETVPVVEVPLVPEVRIPASVSAPSELEMTGTWARYIPHKYRTDNKEKK